MAQDSKRNVIINAAEKRFSHFGVGKTTMNEIADDLSISKASLYYYFPDKLNLYAAVLQKIIDNEDVNSKGFLEERDPLQALHRYLEYRTEFIIKYYNILEYVKTIGTSFPLELEPIFSAARSREINFILSVLSKGIEAEILKVENPPEIAELLLQSFDGLRLAVLSKKSNFFPDKAQFYALLEREKQVASIFFKALNR